MAGTWGNSSVTFVMYLDAGENRNNKNVFHDTGQCDKFEQLYSAPAIEGEHCWLPPVTGWTWRNGTSSEMRLKFHY